MPDRRRVLTPVDEITPSSIDTLQGQTGDTSSADIDPALFGVLKQTYGDKAHGAMSDTSSSTVETVGEAGSDDEVAPEVLARFQKQLKRDVGRVKERQGRMGDEEKAAYLAYFADPSSLSEEQVLDGLTAADIQKAVQMQGMGEFVGVSKGDQRVILISRGDEDGSREPERFGFRASRVEMVDGTKQPKQGEKPLRITTDTPERDALMSEIRESGLWGDSIDIRDAVKAMGLEMPTANPNIIAAVEVITGNNFVKGRRTTYYTDAVMDFDHSSRGELVRVVYCGTFFGLTNDCFKNANERQDGRGAVCVLRGSKILEI